MLIKTGVRENDLPGARTPYKELWEDPMSSASLRAGEQRASLISFKGGVVLAREVAGRIPAPRWRFTSY